LGPETADLGDDGAGVDMTPVDLDAEPPVCLRPDRLPGEVLVPHHPRLLGLEMLAWPLAPAHQRRGVREHVDALAQVSGLVPGRLHLPHWL
jgi:hypothetical protein